MRYLSNCYYKFLEYQARQKPIDRWLLLAVLTITVIGLIMLASASSVVAFRSFGDGYFYFKRQLVWAVIGFLFFWFGSRIDYKFWQKMAWPALILSFILLIALFIPGLARESNSSTSWLVIFGMSIQPSEIVKLLFLIYLSAWFANRKTGFRQAGLSGQLLPMLLVYGAVALLILMQPDLGTLVILTSAVITVFFVSNVKMRYLLTMIGVGILGLVLLVSTNNYQQNRFKCLLLPDYSPMEYCYQVNQSKIAIGSGGWFGRGVGASRQKFLTLPEVHNDFIFAIIAEEIGFVFSGFIIGLYILLFCRGLSIAKNSSDPFAKNLAAGITGWLCAQTIFNIGGITNLMPMTGVPLPLISYGGSALVSSLFALGILANISRQNK